MNNNTNSMVNAAIVAIAIVIVAFLAMAKVDKFIRAKAASDCAVVARFEKTNTSDNSHVYYPIPDQYDKCLKEAGVK